MYSVICNMYSVICILLYVIHKQPNYVKHKQDADFTIPYDLVLFP